MNETEREGSPFASPEEELKHLRERLDSIERRERERGFEAGTTPSIEAMKDEVRVYQKEPVERVLTPEFRQEEEKVSELALNLTPETHDKQISELMRVVQEKGVRNALAVVDAMDNPHIEDDFHRFLVEYLREGYSITDLKEREPLRRSLNHTLFEIILPGEQGSEQRRPLSEILSSMEQLYIGLCSLASKDNIGQPYFSIELAIPSDTNQYSFYASIPNDKLKLFEKQVTSVFSDAQIIQQNDDFNIFSEDGVAVGSYATSKGSPIYPLKTYDKFEYDPLNIILNSFSKLDEIGEGAAIQFILSPDSDEGTFKRYKRARDAINKGVSVGEAVDRAIHGAVGEFTSDVKRGLKDLILGSSKPKEQKEDDHRAVIEKIESKISTPLIHTNIRLIASSKSEHDARMILEEMEASFKQFEQPEGNGLIFTRVQGKSLDRLLKDFTFRFYDPYTMIPLNMKELTTLFHFERLGITSAHGLKTAQTVVEPPPSGLPKKGMLLGYNSYRGDMSEIYMDPEDRLRHFYAIGQTGTGKTSLLKNMIVQDIKNGEGVCMIDPHGVDIQDVLSLIPQERIDDVIYFDPSDTQNPMGINMLEYDPSHPELKTFVVNEMFSIFQKLYANVPESMGPMFEQYFRNATGLVIEDPSSGNTLLDVSRVLSNKEFRDYKISRCNNPIIVQFWEEIATKAGGEASLANIVPYITNKFDVFLSNEIMRPIVAQEKSSFNFKDIMNSRKILLVNLSKGKLGEVNARLLGMIIVGKLLMAALARDDLSEASPYYLYIDEFQNFTTDSISTILSEARKYKLSLHLAHQFIGQLDDSIKNAVFGNVGSMVAFRVGAKDTEFLQSYFNPPFDATDLMNIDNYQAHLKLLVSGRPVKPFTLQTYPPEKGNKEKMQQIVELSRQKYGGDRQEIEAEIMRKYRK